jgi:hypothetical protein
VLMFVVFLFPVLLPPLTLLSKQFNSTHLSYWFNSLILYTSPPPRGFTVLKGPWPPRFLNYLDIW